MTNQTAPPFYAGKTRLRIGTRASQLALWQANWVADSLQKNGIEVEIVKMTASGDRPETFATPIASGATQGIFTRVIQDALLDNTVDIAVHSLKDLPTEPVPGLQLTAVPLRAPVEDVLVMSKAVTEYKPQSLADLPDGCVIGTSSLRRRAQLLYFARENGKTWNVQAIRGNLNTRFRKLDEGLFDALILAHAGVARLELSNRITAVLHISEMFPAVGQGALGIESRTDDAPTNAILRHYINDATTFACVTAERAFLKALDGGCATPIAGNCTYFTSETGRGLVLAGRVIAIDGREMLEDQMEVRLQLDSDVNWAQKADELGKSLANRLISRGADALIREARG